MPVKSSKQYVMSKGDGPPAVGWKRHQVCAPPDTAFSKIIGVTAISPKTSIQNTIAVFSSLECPQLNVGYSLKGYAEEPYSSCGPSQRAEFGFTPQGKEQAERDNPGHKRL